jgi:predicted alpha/beta hydrolase family esterase
METQNCIIIHGCPSKEPKTPEERTYDKHWIPWLKQELEDRDIKTEVPLMPTPWDAKYEEFKEVFENYKVDENTVLIGHSCGTAFLVRWLSESKQKVHKLILVAPWKIALTEKKRAFYNFPIDKDLKNRVDQIVLFTSNDEEENGKKSLEMYHDVLDGELIELENHGHFVESHMGTNKFPELLEKVLE